MTDRHIAVLFIFALIVGFAVAAFGQSGRYGDGHAQGHDMYRTWSPPNNPKTSCCNAHTPENPAGDCRPTRAYMHDDGLWRAWNGYLWLTVPPDKVLPTDFAGDGRSHLCEKGTHIYCFAPTTPKG